MYSIKTIVCGIAIFLLVSSCIFAQNSDEKITERQKQIIINKAIELLKENYVFPERISSIEATIMNKFDGKEYANFNTAIDFAKKITKDLEEIGKDKHLGIFYGPEWVSKIKAGNNPNGSANPPKQFLEMIKYENFGLRKVERMEGNIGYFNFTAAVSLEYSKDTIIGAMNFIAHSDAIIFDIRQNDGFPAEVVLFLESYFLPDNTKVGTFKRRVNNETIDLYTVKDPAVKKIPDSVPLFIVVDNKTSSGAEALAYELQQFKRAIIIGEQTLGEANPGKRFAVSEQLWMMIPTAISSNAITGKNWEQIGVTPDIKINKDKSLQAAILEASKSIVAKTKIKTQKQILNWQIPLLENEINPQPLTDTIISNLVGDYEDGRKILSENGILYYANNKGKKSKLTYIGNRTFQREDQKELRLVMPYTDKPVKEIEWLWNDGEIEKMKRFTK